jgi:hypothetical protein
VFWSYSTLDWLKNDWRTRWFCFGLGFLLAQAAWAQQAAHVDGVVRDPNGKTVPGVHVILYLDDASAHYEAQTDADGTFTLSVAAGRYQLRAEQSAYSAVEERRRGQTLRTDAPTYGSDQATCPRIFLCIDQVR